MEIARYVVEKVNASNGREFLACVGPQPWTTRPGWAATFPTHDRAAVRAAELTKAGTQARATYAALNIEDGELRISRL